MEDLEVKYLGTRGGANYFVQYRECKQGQGEEEAIDKFYVLIETYSRDDHGLREYFRNNFDYKEEWKYQVNNCDEECSYDAFKDYINDNWRDYVDNVADRCGYDTITERYRENEDDNYSSVNVEVTNIDRIVRSDDSKWNLIALTDIDSDTSWENVDTDIWYEIKTFFGDFDFRYIN